MAPGAQDGTGRTPPPTPAEAGEFAPPVRVIGAGPAGLTAAYRLAQAGCPVEVYEADTVVGGISRTVERDGWRFDIGGHRFFTKVRVVEELWDEILPGDDFMLRPRLSRIQYRGRLFDYPLRAMNALRGLGALEACRCVGSYAWARMRPPKDQSTFEGWTTARFGRRLYSIFFKTYTEKVWGVPAASIQADWAAQRIKNLSLSKAILSALRPGRNQKAVTSLIEEFRYPKYGPGMMWERTAELVEKAGGTVRLDTRVVAVHRDAAGATGLTIDDGDLSRVDAKHIISSMPLSELVAAMDPPAPPEVRAAARGLRYRDFLTVALVVPQEYGFPDNWIYIHTPGVHVGRIQNFGAWSPFLVKDGRTCLGLEYFVTEGDALWSRRDEDLVALATDELRRVGLIDDPSVVQAGYAVRIPKAYPTYDGTYKDNVDVIRAWLDREVPNVYPVGRNGMHRYNNQDHSMLTAMLSVENILAGAGHDVWSVNVEEDYHEQRTPGHHGTGRAAPVVSSA
jgi:protoporphyrinogen oxidase